MYYMFRKVLVLYVRIAVYGRITAVPYRIKPLKPQNTVRNVRTVTVYGPPTIRPLPYTVRCGALPPPFGRSGILYKQVLFDCVMILDNHSKCQTLVGILLLQFEGCLFFLVRQNRHSILIDA